jgi:MFS transporter, DHA2 family, multidrug resistance protein
MVSAFVHDPPHLKRGIAAIDWGGIILLTVRPHRRAVVLERGEEVDWFASRWIVFGDGGGRACADGAGGVGNVFHR